MSTDAGRGYHACIVEALAEQGVDTRAMGLAYGRRALPWLDAMGPCDAYVHGFMDGVRATLGLWPLVEAKDWGEFYARLYDADVLAEVEPWPADKLENT